MSSIQGAKAIHLSQSDAIAERPFTRTFAVKSGSNDYVVTLGVVPIGEPITARRDACTCEAGRRGVKCYHVGAARLRTARTPRPAAFAEALDLLRESHGFLDDARATALLTRVDALLSAHDVPMAASAPGGERKP